MLKKGSRSCGNCPPGYAGNGLTCSYQGVCNVNNGGCHPLATCRYNTSIYLFLIILQLLINSITGISSSFVECVCPIGYMGSGLGPNGCVRSPQFNPNACNSNPCQHGYCRPLNTTLAYLCICTRGWTGNLKKKQ